MNNQLLKAKHWQVFILTFLIPTAIYFVIVISFSLKLKENPDLTISTHVMQQIILVKLIQLFLFFFLIFSITIGLQKKLPEFITMKTKMLKASIVTCIATLTINSVLFFFIFNKVSTSVDLNYFDFNLLSWILILIPFQILFALSSLYLFYFAAKALKSIELKRAVKFDDFIAEFFGFFFYPVGVWILQPRINKLLK